jgi:hypothetical protein
VPGTFVLRAANSGPQECEVRAWSFLTFFQSCNQCYTDYIGVGLMAYRYGTESVVNDKTRDLFYLLTLQFYPVNYERDVIDDVSVVDSHRW